MLADLRHIAFFQYLYRDIDFLFRDLEIAIRGHEIVYRDHKIMISSSLDRILCSQGNDVMIARWNITPMEIH